MAIQKCILLGAVLILVFATAFASPALSETLTVDCTKGETLAKAVARAKPGDTIRVTGTCKENVTITTDRLTLDGQGSAILDGGSVGKESTVMVSEDFLPLFEGVLTIAGARGVIIKGFTIQHGADGITCKGGAMCSVRNTTMQDNADEGIQVSQNAMAEIINCTVRRNSEWGIVVVDSSSVVFDGTIITNNNGRSGIGIFGASSASLFGEVTIQAHNNALHGIEINGASNMFTVRGTISVGKNGRDGISVGSNSNLFDFGATFLAKANGRAGLRVDDSAGVTLSKSIITDNGTDVALSFGARATLKGNTIGTITCDKSSMIRGDVACPK